LQHIIKFWKPDFSFPEPTPGGSLSLAIKTFFEGFFIFASNIIKAVVKEALRMVI
jgi:hypothetical protein